MEMQAAASLVNLGDLFGRNPRALGFFLLEFGAEV
jgi:hypothetical protein